METQYFEYGARETRHLRARDAALGREIERIGHIRREVIPDLFEALVHAVVGQQISSKAQRTIWRRIREDLVEVTPERVAALPVERVQGYGMSFKKARTIQNAAQRILCGELDLQRLQAMEEAAFCRTLSSLEGIGLWTAQMLLIFCLERPNVMSYQDFGIRKGLCRLYGLQRIDREQFEDCLRRFSPYATVASLYLWEIAAEKQRPAS